MTTMVERVAAAIFAAVDEECDYTRVDIDGEVCVDGYLSPAKVARAAIEAMREPTLKMHNAAALAGLCGEAPTLQLDADGRIQVAFQLANPSEVFTAMIDAALNEKEST